MKSAPAITLYDFPLSEVRERARRAVDALHESRARLSARCSVPGDRVSCFRSLDEAIETIERLLPGFAAPPRTLLSRTLAELTPNERCAVRRAIDAERGARQRLVQMIGDVPVTHVEDALARIEAREWVASELSALWQAAQTAPVSRQC